MSRSAMLLVLTLLTPMVIVPAFVPAQEPDENDPARAAALVREAVAARGGDAYLKIRTVESRGQFTPFEKGVSGDPLSFVDYVAYPGRERTEFGKGDEKFVQTNSEIANWVYEAKQKMIRDQKEEQIKQFQQSARYDIDNLLRTASQQSGVKLIYLGRREAWRNTFSEAVRVDFADGGAATLHFDPRAKLPLMIEYKTVGEEGSVNNEVRYYRWVDFGGIKFPTLQDFYRNGKQNAHVSFDTVSFNVSLPDKLFAKPTNIKEVK
ncbi:MAG: hypothetical protein AABN34_19895 [Acidobacteriota bacterium]